MNFRDMSREEKVLKTYKDLQARKKVRERAKIEAERFEIENMYRVKQKQFRMRVDKFAAY